MILIQLIVQMVLIGIFVFWLAMMIEESRQKDLRIDRLMSELQYQKYRMERMMDVNKEAMLQTVDLVGDVLLGKVKKEDPYYVPTNQ